MPQQVNDPAILELKSIVENRLVTNVSYMFANLQEANVELDQVASAADSFPVLVHVATGKKKEKVIETGEIQSKFAVAFLLLNKIDSSTSDFKSEEVQPVIYQMQQLARNLVYTLNKSPMSVDGGVDEWEMEDEYAFGDAHLFGVRVILVWDVNLGITGFMSNFDTSGLQ